MHPGARTASVLPLNSLQLQRKWRVGSALLCHTLDAASLTLAPRHRQSAFRESGCHGGARCDANALLRSTHDSHAPQLWQRDSRSSTIQPCTSILPRCCTALLLCCVRLPCHSLARLLLSRCSIRGEEVREMPHKCVRRMRRSTSRMVMDMHANNVLRDRTTKDAIVRFATQGRCLCAASRPC